MNFLFRVDAGGKIGLGHYYRSLSLAELLNKKGHKVTFIHCPSLFWDNAKRTKFPYKVFEINLDKGITELEIIKKNKIDVFYVDGIIEFQKDYIEKIKKYSRVVFYQNISDSRNLADIFILPSIHKNEDYFNSFGENSKIYQGLDYFTFNPDILLLEPKKVAKTVDKIGVISGGSDPKNTLIRILNMIDFDIFSKIDFIFYYGENYLFKDKLSSIKHNNVSFQLFDHKEIIKNDLLISSFGVSTYEFMVMGMPIIAYGHQESNANAANILEKKTHSIISIGLIDNLKTDILNNMLIKLVKNYRLRKKLSASAKSLLDLKGVNRVLKILEQVNDE